MEQAQLEKEQRIQKLAIEVKKSEHERELQECTFSPRIQVTNLNRQYEEKVGGRHGR
jgi:hypothetical protein